MEGDIVKILNSKVWQCGAYFIATYCSLTESQTLPIPTLWLPGPVYLCTKVAIPHSPILDQEKEGNPQNGVKKTPALQ